LTAIDPLLPVPFLNVIESLRRCEMKNSTFISELHNTLGAPSSEIVESLRLLRGFMKLAPPQRDEVLELIERLAGEDLPSSEHPLS
jgi:hypothetical protein